MEEREMNGGYSRFFVMIIVSMVVMYLLSYTNSWEVFGHAWFSETRVYMVAMMGGAMAIIMLTFMREMYRSRRMNTGIYVGSVIVMGVALVGVQPVEHRR